VAAGGDAGFIGASGITAGNNDVNLRAQNTLILNNDINAGTGDIRLVTIGAGLSENAGRLIGMPVPPLALSDEVALDLLYKVDLQNTKDLGLEAYPNTPPHQLIADLVLREERIGRKSGKGFYDYPEGGGKQFWPGLAKLAPRAAQQPDIEELKRRLLVIQALEAARCIEEQVIGNPADGDVGSLLGWGFSPWTGGPLSYIDMMGVRNFVDTCDRLARLHGDRFKPNAQLRKMAERGERFYPATPWAAAA